ncbi:MAG: hypothetical protein WAV27_00355 [Xanthobacteraceae bacterium]|jgi:hypothetical protein
MLDMLLCYGFAANMIRAGYLGLVGDLFRQLWASCHRFGAVVATGARRPSLSGAAYIWAGRRNPLRRLARCEIHVTSMT